MKLLLRKSIRDLRSNVLLNLSVFVISFVGIFLFGGLNVTGLSLKNSIDEFYHEQNLASYTVTKELSYEEFSALHRLEDELGFEFDGAKELDSVTLNIGGKRRNIEVSIFGNEMKVNIPQIVEGRLPETSFEALIDVAFAKANGISSGDVLTIAIEGEAYEVSISGLAIFPDHLYKGDAIPKLAETGIVKLYVDLETDVNTLYVNTPLSEIELRKKLSSSGISFAMARVLGRSENVSVMRIRSDIELITSLINILPWVCLVSLCLILYVNASKRAEDEGYNVGVMTANGLDKRKIVFSLMLPYLMNVFIAGLVGSVLGVIIVPRIYIGLLSEFYTLPSIKLSGIFVAFIALFILLAVTALSLIAAMSALFARTPSALMSKRQKGSSRIMKSISAPITLKLSLRNFASYKKKSLFTMLSAALCLGLLFTSFMLDDSVSGLNKTVYGKYYNYDYTISWNSGDGLDYDEIKTLAEQSDLFENIMFCLEFPAEYDDKNVLVSIIDDKNPCYKIEGMNGTGACIPTSYGYKKDISIKLYSAIPFEISLPVTSSYKDIGMFGIIVPLSAIRENYPAIYSYMTSGVSTKLYLKCKAGSDAEVFAEMIGEKYSVAFSTLEHSVDSDRFKELFTVLTATELLLIVVCGIMMAVMVLNISSLSLSDRIRDYAIFKALGVGGDKVNALSSLENAFSVFFSYLLAFPIGALISTKIIKAVAMVTGVVAYLGVSISSALILFVCAAIFTAIGNILINNKIKKVNVASALKEE